MSEAKNKVLKYCSQFDYANVEHIDNAIENKRLIQEGRYGDLNGCPSSYGLDDFEGLCFTEQVKGYEAQKNQCEECWRKALEI